MITIIYILEVESGRTQEAMHIDRSLLQDVLMAMFKTGVQIVSITE